MLNNLDNNDTNNNIDPTIKKLKEFENIEDFEDNNLLRPSGVRTYVKKKDKYEDLKSTAILFIIVSMLGVIYLILNMLKIISLVNGAYSYIVLSGLFLVFLFIGISTYRKAKQVSLEIDDENAKTKEINDWLKLNITKDKAKQLFEDDHFEHDEVYYLKLTERIKELVKAEFKDLDENYLDVIVEEYYDEHLE